MLTYGRSAYEARPEATTELLAMRIEYLDRRVRSLERSWMFAMFAICALLNIGIVVGLVVLTR